MRISKHALRVLELVESKRHLSFQDTGGVWTIGIGHTRNVGPDMEADDEMIYAWLGEDMAMVDAAIKNLVLVPLTQPHLDALALFVFNKGVNAFARSTLLKRVNARIWDDVPAQLGRWHFDNGNDVYGLRVRSAVEQFVWLGNAPKIDTDFIEVLRRTFR